MQVGDLVKAPYLMDHDGSVGIVIDIDIEEQPVIRFASEIRRVFAHLLEVISASR